jgi:hypothetical protein
MWTHFTAPPCKELQSDPPALSSSEQDNVREYIGMGRAGTNHISSIVAK